MDKYQHFYKQNLWILVIISFVSFVENILHHWYYSAAATLGLFILLVGIRVFWFNKATGKTVNEVIPKWLNWLIIGIFQLGLLALFFSQGSQMLGSGFGRLLLVCLMAFISTIVHCHSKNHQSPYLNWSITLLTFGALYRLGVFIPQIQATPFSLGWSEGSRYYNASLFLSEKIYGEQLPLPVLHPSRYLMQALPFFLGVRSILAHRLWQVLLWIGMTAWGAALLAKRYRGKVALPLWLLIIGLALFFFQGAVYFHLMVCVILVLIGYRKDKLWRTLLFVLLASVWAGISRVNWMPLPGLLAAALYLLDEPLEGKPWLKYLTYPVLWAVAGVGTAWLSQQLYIRLSGNDPALFGSAFSSALLWNRLWPNRTFILGIVPGIIIVCIPAILFIRREGKNGQKPQFQWLRWLGLSGILFAFLVGGIVASLKIGGGGDLHNLDGFLVFWALIAGSLILGAYAPDDSVQPTKVFNINNFEWLIAVIVPLLFTLMQGARWDFNSRISTLKDVEEMQTTLNALQDQPGEVLFISERQMVTFGNLIGIRMIPDYEKVFLMEMAMSNNQMYLLTFYQNLEAHTYKAIITDSIKTNWQGETHSFGSENDAWVGNVLLPMLEEYELAASWQSGEVNLLIPKGQPELLQAIQQLAP